MHAYRSFQILVQHNLTGPLSDRGIDLVSFLYMHVDTSTIAKAALFNEIRTLKKAGRHPNIVSLIGTWINGGKLGFDNQTLKPSGRILGEH